MIELSITPFGLEAKKTMGTHIIDVPESITVRSINEFSQTLLAALEAHEDVVCDLTTVLEMDLSLIQVMEAARVRNFQQGGVLRLSHPATEEMTALLDRAGFMADLAPADIDFWFHGSAPR